MLAPHQAVVRQPAERDLGERQPVRLRGGLDLRERGKVRVVPVALAVVLWARAKAVNGSTGEKRVKEGGRGRGRTRPWPFSGSKREPGSTVS